VIVWSPISSTKQIGTKVNQIAGCIGRAPHDVPNLPAFLEWGASDTAVAFIGPNLEAAGSSLGLFRAFRALAPEVRQFSAIRVPGYMTGKAKIVGDVIHSAPTEDWKSR
jgi:hypothetical protein